MASFTTLVNVDADTASKLCHMISQLMVADGEQYFNTCRGMIESNQTDALIEKIMEQKDVILALDSEIGM